MRLLVFVVVMLAAAAVIIAAIAALRGRESTSISDGAWYYVNGEKSSLVNGSGLSREDGITTVTNKNEEYSLAGQIIYEDNGNTMLFQNDMLWYNTKEDTMKRIVYFGRMSASGSTYTVKHGGSTDEISGGFLYDNGDIYVILEKAVLNYENDSLELSAGSTISCNYSGDVQVILKDGTGVIIDQPGQNLAVTFSNGCTLNPLVDTYYQANGTWRILHTSVDIVPEL